MIKPGDEVQVELRGRFRKYGTVTDIFYSSDGTPILIELELALEDRIRIPWNAIQWFRTKQSAEASA